MMSWEDVIVPPELASFLKKIKLQEHGRTLVGLGFASCTVMRIHSPNVHVRYDPAGVMWAPGARLTGLGVS